MSDNTSKDASASHADTIPHEEASSLPILPIPQLDLAFDLDDEALVAAPSSALSAPGKDEMNLAEFPFAVLAKRVAAGQKTIEVIQEGRDALGRPVRQEWLVTGSEHFGLPVATDDDTYVALMKLLRDNQFRERTVRFTVSQLLRTMRSNTGKRDYERVAASLDRLTGVLLRSKNAFWDHAKRSYVTEAFHLLDSYRLATGGSGRELSEVTFSPFLFGSIQAGYVKNLDVDFYFLLSTPLARRLYRLLDKHRYRAQVYDISLERLARKLPLQDKYESQIRRRLDPVFAELAERGFLAGVQYRTGVQGTTIVQIRFAERRSGVTVLAHEVPARLPAASGGHSGKEGTETHEGRAALGSDALIERLITVGVSRAVAEDLVQNHPAADVERQLAYLPYVENLKNPGGYLRLAIVDGYGPPPKYPKPPKKAPRKTQTLPTMAPMPDGRDTASLAQDVDDLGFGDAAAGEDVPEELRPAWRAVLALLSETVRKPAFETHVRPLRPLRIEESPERKTRVVVEAPSTFTRDWVVKHYRDRITQTLQASLGGNGDQGIEVRFLLPPDKPDQAAH
ncbi:MAG: replication initiator protein A [Armatimonadota bacterium]